MKLNKKILKYIDGELLNKEKDSVENEIASSAELNHQYNLVKSVLFKTSVIKKGRIQESYFESILPSFRNNSTKENIALNPAYIGVVIMVLVFVVTIIFQTGNNFDSEETTANSDYNFNRNEFTIFLNETELNNEDFNNVYTSELNVDSLINDFITSGILNSQSIENLPANIFNINPDELELNEKDVDELFATILNKKFF